MATQQRPQNLSEGIPLCVSLDRTLVRSDTLVEAMVRLVQKDILNVFRLLLWRARGRYVLEERVAACSSLDVTLLPVNDELLGWLKEQRLHRRLILWSPSGEPAAEHIGAHYGIFDEVVAGRSAAGQAESKAARLVDRFGARGFDYAGHGLGDLGVWRSARRAVVVEPGRRLLRRLESLPDVEKTFPAQSNRVRAWLRELRLHQWSKNLLLFLPAAGAHMLLRPQIAFECVAAFIIFGLCASGTYLLNDLMDLDSDRRHPTKRSRPFASGDLSLLAGLAVAPALVAGGLLLGWLVLGWTFFATLAAYVVATVWYSRSLKRIPMVDVLTLAGLYSLRVIAGSAATFLLPSFWLLALTMFLFLSLAVAKRYSELKLMMASGRTQTLGRGYTVDDAPLLQSCGLSAGYISVLVMALYVNSDMAQKTYAHVQLLWLLCPLLLYWITRVWIKTSRGQMDDDPVVFTLRDRPSIIVGCVAFLLVVAAAQ